MKPEHFELYSELVKRRSGLVLSSDKAYLLETRLMPIARKRSFINLEEMAIHLSNEIGPEKTKLEEEITEAMTTNESSFFRDTRPFDIFKNHVLPILAEPRKITKKIRIWSAACSSGQEAYSLAMVLEEEKSKYPGFNFEIMCTDISGEMVERAREGIYTQFEIQRGLPITHLVKYFEKAGDKWKVQDNLRKYVKFREFNLLENLGSLGTFDIVFCRNVLIYFDPATKTDVLHKIKKQMAKDGMLFLGGAETVLGITEEFKPVKGQRGLYEFNQPALVN